MNVTAWLAIDRVTLNNSPVLLVPTPAADRRRGVPHLPRSPIRVGGFDQAIEADPEAFDAADAEPMLLEPGQFFLFDESTLHYSAENSSELQRLALAIRIVPCDTVVGGGKGGPCVLLKGRDSVGANTVVEMETE